MYPVFFFILFGVKRHQVLVIFYTKWKEIIIILITVISELIARLINCWIIYLPGVSHFGQTLYILNSIKYKTHIIRYLFRLKILFFVLINYYFS